MIALGNKGALAEHIAMAYLLREGYDVYRNVSIHGAIDMIAIRGAEMLKLDVKTLRGSGPYGVTQKQREIGVKLLVVNPSTGECVISDPPAPRQPARCAVCDKLFIPRLARQLYCHDRCANRAAYARNPERFRQYQRDRKNRLRAEAGQPPLVPRGGPYRKNKTTP